MFESLCICAWCILLICRQARSVTLMSVDVLFIPVMASATCRSLLVLILHIVCNGRLSGLVVLVGRLS